MRYSEVDLARATAMLMMAVYHTAFDLRQFYEWNIDLDAPEWVIFQKMTLILFLMLVGVSGVLLRLKATTMYKTFLRRALIILLWSFVITLVTYLMDPSTAIFFGVLQCIGVSMLLLPLFLPLGLWNAPLGIAIMLLGIRFPLPAPFTTLDYVPLFPNFGFILLGAALGHLLYKHNVRPSTWRTPAWMHPLSLPGRYALAFYLVHQPIILTILALFLGWPKFM